MKQHLATLAAKAATWVPDALMVGGAVGISYGAGLIYQPAAWLVGGAFALGAGVLLARGGK